MFVEQGGRNLKVGRGQEWQLFGSPLAPVLLVSPPPFKCKESLARAWPGGPQYNHAPAWNLLSHSAGLSWV